MKKISAIVGLGLVVAIVVVALIHQRTIELETPFLKVSSKPPPVALSPPSLSAPDFDPTEVAELQNYLTR